MSDLSERLDAWAACGAGDEDTTWITPDEAREIVLALRALEARSATRTPELTASALFAHFPLHLWPLVEDLVQLLLDIQKNAAIGEPDWSGIEDRIKAMLAAAPVAATGAQEAVAYRFCLDGQWFTGSTERVCRKQLTNAGLDVKIEPLYAAPQPVASAPEERDTETAPWIEIHKLRAAIRGPEGFATWQEAATAERILRVKAVALADVANAECTRLREVEHRVWHLLDDSEQRDEEIVLMRGHDYDELLKLLPEDHPRVPDMNSGTQG